MARNGSRAEQQKIDPPPYVPGMDAAGAAPNVVDFRGVTKRFGKVTVIRDVTFSGVSDISRWPPRRSP